MLYPIIVYRGIMLLDKIKAFISPIRKMLVGSLTTVALAALHARGWDIPSDQLRVAIDALVVALVVYFVPNAQKVLD